MKRSFLLGIVIGIFIPILSAYLFVVSGGMPVATKARPLPLEKYIAGKALHAAMKAEIHRPSPIGLDEANLMAGAKIYKEQCGFCHGLPHHEAAKIAKAMFPPPPQLFVPDEGVTDDPVGETFWKVKNGIRLTGMPSFVDSLSEAEIWQVSGLLLKANQLPASVEKFLNAKH